jgi:hypothetical protein
MVPALEEDDQHVERLRRDGDEAAVSPQLALDGIRDEGTESIPAARFLDPDAVHVAPPRASLSS